VATFKEVLFSQEAVDVVQRFYRFHQNEIGFKIFSSLINQQYDFGLTLQNGHQFIKSPTDRLITDFEEMLGRSGWVLINENLVHEVVQVYGLYSCNKYELIIFEDDFIKIQGYSPCKGRLHILVARAKRPSLLNFKKFKTAIKILLENYSLITASSATSPDVLIGLDKDWRFNRIAGSTRLRQYWGRVGFKPVGGHKNRIYISKPTDSQIAG
jgi:hypothetical protein